MLRFPNPGSDIASFIRIYQELFDALADRPTFDLDDMSNTLVERNLATSCGYMGAEALARSTRANRSLDPLYNQSKMYSELYKALGWIHPTQGGALVFTHTYLGAHVPLARRDPAGIFSQSLLGIAHPTAVLQTKGDFNLRPFAAILRTADALGGLICRDEMIVGPMCLQDDRDQEQFSAMIDELAFIRGEWSRLEAKMSAVSEVRAIAPNTMRNYTRFPLAALKWTGWMADQRRNDIYGKAIGFLVLTDEGLETLGTAEACRDIRAADLDKAGDVVKAATSRLGFYDMMDRAGFDISIMRSQLSVDRVQAAPLLGDDHTPVLFSPFQELAPGYVASLFPSDRRSDEGDGATVGQGAAETAATAFAVRRTLGSSERSLLPPSRVCLAVSETPLDTDLEADFMALFKHAVELSRDFDSMVELIAEQYRGANQDVFYALVVQLFRALGHDCELSRPGVNYQRWDAIIPDDRHSMPIEIKSPGEEEHISVKAVRQALENKVVLLARKQFATEYRTTSLVVGYSFPNNRSEVASLVFDIDEAFGIVIGIIDFRSLLRLVGARILRRKAHSPHQLWSLHGFIDVSDA